jgi:pyruvate kinase
VSFIGSVGIGRKIVCTIGPSCEDRAILSKMIASGMDVARLNLSHGSRTIHRRRFSKIRSLDRHVAIMFDIQGPKIRLGRFDGAKEVVLTRGDIFVLTSRAVLGSAQTASVDYPRLPEIASPKDTIFLNDGLVELSVVRVDKKTDVVCRVKTGGEIGTGKGVNILGKSFDFSVPTEKDLEDLKFVAKLKPDFLSVSFVSSAGEIAKVREVLRKMGADIPLIAKIERKEAVSRIDSIIRESDGIMIARGDLAVFVSSEKVPPIQKNCIERTRESGKPVICATQMLESMRFHSRPSRAEASDVFNAVLDGADALMLSGETAIGKYPLESLKMMKRLIKEAEVYRSSGRNVAPAIATPIASGDVLAEALSKVSAPGKIERRHLKVVVHPVRSEDLPFISTFLPGLSVLAPTDDLSLFRRMRVYGGIVPLLVKKDTFRRNSSGAIVTELKKRGIVKSRDRTIAVRLHGDGGKTRVRSVEYL